jgi:hypothetical protein
MELSKLESSFFETLENTDLKQLGTDLGEVAFDSLISGSEGVLKDIPVFSTIRSVYGIVGTISNHFYAKKLWGFLVGIKDIPPEERRQQLWKLIADAEERQRTGETTLMLLDRLTDMRKPLLMANAFKAFLREQISFDEMLAFYHAIDGLVMPYAKHMLVPSGTQIPYSVCLHFASLGLGPVPYSIKKPGMEEVRELGRKFVRYVLKGDTL